MKSVATVHAESELQKQKQEMLDLQEWKGVKWWSELQVKGQSCPGSLSQVEVHPGTSYRLCQSGGYRRTVEPAPHLGCYPAASQSTSTHFLLWTHTGLCNRCWSEERRVSGSFFLLAHTRIYYLSFTVLWMMWFFFQGVNVGSLSTETRKRSQHTYFVPKWKESLSESERWEAWFHLCVSWGISKTVRWVMGQKINMYE